MNVLLTKCVDLTLGYLDCTVWLTFGCAVILFDGAKL